MYIYKRKGKHHVAFEYSLTSVSKYVYPNLSLRCKVSLKQLIWMAPAQGLLQRGMTLTLDSLKGFEIFYTEQWLGQLPDEELQQAGGIMLLNTFPIKSPFIKLCFQFLAKILKGRREREKKTTSKCMCFFFLLRLIYFPLYKRFYSFENTFENTKGQHFSITQKNTPPPTPSVLHQWKWYLRPKILKLYTCSWTCTKP